MTVTKPNSIAMRMTMVACDRADLVATLRWGNEWDIAAAHLVAQEAGAVVTDALGTDNPVGLAYQQARTRRGGFRGVLIRVLRTHMIPS